MFSKIFLSKENLLYNVNKIEEISKKKTCVMIKANAYGHGTKEVLSILNDRIDFFGVSNQSEGLYARKYTTKDVIVFGACEDYKQCIINNVSFALFSYDDARKIVKIAKKCDLKPKMHLCINTGMNRYGVKTEKELLKIISFLTKKGIELAGVYTHFSSLTTDREYTALQKERFYSMLKFIPKSWNPLLHVGGGRSIFEQVDADMFRVGLEVYGYGNEFVKPVLRVESEIVDLQRVSANEHIGYLCGYTAKEDMVIATVPLGYGDGLPRKLSNKLRVKINGKETVNVGNICMDAFMVDVTNLPCKKGDRVDIMRNASELAPLIESTEYEVLTNLGKFRGERIID